VSLNIISSVANGIEKPAELNSTTGFSKKQFYSRMALDKGRVDKAGSRSRFSDESGKNILSR
jgi:hypothetical protein